MRIGKLAVEDTKMLFESNLKSLKRVYQGKIRDIYEVDGSHWLIVTSDRLSAFDVVLPDPIPKKGAVLTTVSNSVTSFIDSLQTFINFFLVVKKGSPECFQVMLYFTFSLFITSSGVKLFLAFFILGIDS